MINTTQTANRIADLLRRLEDLFDQAEDAKVRAEEMLNEESQKIAAAILELEVKIDIWFRAIHDRRKGGDYSNCFLTRTVLMILKIKLQSLEGRQKVLAYFLQSKCTLLEAVVAALI